MLSSDINHVPCISMSTMIQKEEEDLHFALWSVQTAVTLFCSCNRLPNTKASIHCITQAIMQTSFLFIQKYIKKKNKEEIIFTSQFLQIIHFVGASFLQSFLVSPAVSVTTLNNSRGYWQRQVMKMKITTALQPMTVLCISQ